MCLSSTASFVVAAVLAVAGIASIAKIRHQREILFAAIPIILALQAATEGFIWLSFDNSAFSVIKERLAYFFLFVSESVWPIWIPLSLLLMERGKARSILLLALLAVGLFTSVYLAFYLLTYDVEARVLDGQIFYIQHLHSPHNVVSSLPYLSATILPFFVTGIRSMRWFGVIVLLPCLFISILLDYQRASIWCFLAAVISGFVYYTMSSLQANHQE